MKKFFSFFTVLCVAMAISSNAADRVTQLISAPIDCNPSGTAFTVPLVYCNKVKAGDQLVITSNGIVGGDWTVLRFVNADSPWPGPFYNPDMGTTSFTYPITFTKKMIDFIQLKGFACYGRYVTVSDAKYIEVETVPADLTDNTVYYDTEENSAGWVFFDKSTFAGANVGDKLDFSFSAGSVVAQVGWVDLPGVPEMTASSSITLTQEQLDKIQSADLQVYKRNASNLKISVIPKSSVVDAISAGTAKISHAIEGNTLNIGNLASQSDVNIFNLAGQSVRHLSVASPATSIEMPVAGAYIVRVQNASQQISFKVLAK